MVTIVTEKNESDKEIAAKILSGNKCFYEFSKILGSQSLSVEMKKNSYIQLYYAQLSVMRWRPGH